MSSAKQNNRTGFFKWGINILIPLIVALIPVNETFTSTIKWFLVVTVFAIILIATDNIPQLAVSLGLPMCYIVFLKVPAGVVMRAWSLEIPWLILGGFLLTAALNRTGLLKRIAYHCILLFGGSLKGIVYGMMLVGFVASLVIADLSAKIILLGALALGICNALNLKMGDTEASAIGLSALAATLGPSYLFYHGSTGNLVPFGIVGSVGVPVPVWMEYFKHMFLPQLIYVILTAVLIVVLFRPKVEIKSRNYFKEELNGLGKLGTDEIKILIISILLVVGAATSSLHGISVGWLFVIASVIMLLPKIEVVRQEDVKQINFSYVLFVTACLTIGIVSVELGVGQFIADLVYPLIAGSPVRVIVGVWLLGFIINFALTPLAAYSAFTAPIVNMALTAGVAYMPVVYAFIHGLEQVVFPYEYAPVLILFSYGMVSFKNIVKYNSLRAVISLASILILFIPWWKLIGLL